MAIVAMNCNLLMKTEYKSNIEYSIQKIMQKRQTLATQSASIGSAMSQIMMQSTLSGGQDNPFQAQYEIALDNLHWQDVVLELQQKNLETQHKTVSTELETIQKQLDKNIKNEFKLFG